MNTEYEINKVLAGLSESEIDSIEFDLPKFKIRLNLTLHHVDKIEKHLLVFERVSSFFFVHDEGAKRFRIIDWDHAVISEAFYYEKARNHIRHSDDEPMTPQYEAEPNFVIEMWLSQLMIEAQAMMLDDKRFETSIGGGALPGKGA